MLYGKCFTCVSYYYFIPSLLFSNYQHTLHLVTLGCWQLPILLRKKTKTKEHPGVPNTIPFSFSPIMTDKLFVVLLSQPSHFALDFIFSPMQEYRSSNSPVSCITNFSTGSFYLENNLDVIIIISKQSQKTVFLQGWLPLKKQVKQKPLQISHPLSWFHFMFFPFPVE